MASGIRTVETDKDDDGDYTRARLVFGPHHFVELHREKAGGVPVPELRAWDEPRRWRLRVRPRLHNPVPLRRHQDTAQPFDVLGVRQIGGW